MRVAILLACAAFVMCTDLYAQRRVINNLPRVVQAGGDTVDLVASSDIAPTIVVRHLGATCSHCVEQLRALLQHHQVSGPIPTTVYAISSDDLPTCDTMTRKLDISASPIKLCSDADDVCANALGCVISEKDGTITDLHLVMILHHRRVLFEHYSITPLMSFGRVMLIAGEALRR